MTWQKILAQGFASSSELLDYLLLPSHHGTANAEKIFKTRVPRGFAARMGKGDPTDPLLLQVLATEQELINVPEFTADPLKENKSTPLPGILHKYTGRALVLLAGACAVNCRYCFRRHFPYAANNLGRKGFAAVVQYVQSDPSIHELILSGGDPLLVTDNFMETVFESITTIPHLKTLRFHTRIPVVLPERVTAKLCSLLAELPMRKVIVLHCNHAQELNEQVDEGCRKLREAGCFLLNQSVLLKGVNDNVEALVGLSERLFAAGVMPYYLHLLDKVAGASHFDLSTEKALSLYEQLQLQLPGYLVPRLVREEVGKGSKTLVFR